MVSLCIDMIRVLSIDATDWMIISQTKETVLLSNECEVASFHRYPFACTS